MGLKDALETHTNAAAGRRVSCRVCRLLTTLPADEARDLRAWFDEHRSGPKPIVDALAAEGYGDGWYHPVKHHMYICQRRS